MIQSAYICTDNIGSSATFTPTPGSGNGGNGGNKGSSSSPVATRTGSVTRTSTPIGTSTKTGNGGKASVPKGPQNPNTVNTLIYLHSDHLGSVSLVTNSSGQSAGAQEFDPWGKVGTGGTVGTQTVMNFTGQKLDGTGLLNYNARMYDPLVGRFVSPDSIIPGALPGVGGAGGSVGQEKNKHDAELACLYSVEQTIQKEEDRLMDAYSAGVIELSQLQEKPEITKKKRTAITLEKNKIIERAERHSSSGSDAKAIEELSHAVQRGLQLLTFADKRRALELLDVKVLVDDGKIVVRGFITDALATPLHGDNGRKEGKGKPPELSAGGFAVCGASPVRFTLGFT